MSCEPAFISRSHTPLVLLSQILRSFGLWRWLSPFHFLGLYEEKYLRWGCMLCRKLLRPPPCGIGHPRSRSALIWIPRPVHGWHTVSHGVGFVCFQFEKSWRALMLGWQFLRLQLSPAIMHETAEFIFFLTHALSSFMTMEMAVATVSECWRWRTQPWITV